MIHSIHILTIAVLVISCLGLAQQAHAQKPQPAAQMTPEQAMLQRMYNLRARLDQERAQAENEARANVRLVTQSQNRQIDAPTVSGLRAETNVALSRFEQQFSCLDVDVEGNSGNTVVICGGNSGDITGSNVSAERDIVTNVGGTP